MPRACTLAHLLWPMLVLLACSDDGAAASGEGSAGDGGSETGAATQTSSAASTGTASAASSGSESASASGTSDATGSASDATTTDPSADGSGSSGDATTDASTSAGDTGTVGTTCDHFVDCTVVDDCCTCAAIHVDDEPPACAIDCDVTACELAGLDDGVQCEFGTCQLDPVACDPSQVLCDVAPPACAEGTLPSVDGSCWSGLCVPAEACDVVGDCSDCPPGQACIPLLAEGPQGVLCSPVPEVCKGLPGCTCMPGVCPDEFSACVDTVDGFQCECLLC